jgi:steroid 5-alpha reductase family enzyme
MGTAVLPSTLPVILLLFGLTLMVVAPGFHRLVYFVSIGYAFAITVMGLATIFIFRQNIHFLSLLQNLLLVVWGLRLGIFLLQREIRPSFQEQARETADQYGSTSLPRKIAIWLGVSVLYVAMFLPGLASAASQPPGVSIGPVIARAFGAFLMLGGLVIEALADWQKSAFKARFPKMYCNAGLYGWVRCPNYLGEILFWLGNWVMGMFFYYTALVWIASLVGLVCIILIMFGSTRRLERAQDQRYGDLPAYQNYVQSVPVLFPFIPVYTLKKFRVYLE